MTRLWILPNQITYRMWVSEEYHTHTPKDPIIEKVPHMICKKCGADLGTGTDIHPIYTHCYNCNFKNFNPYKYKNLKTELICLEFGEKEIDGIIVPYTKIYEKENEL